MHKQLNISSLLIIFVGYMLLLFYLDGIKKFCINLYVSRLPVSLSWQYFLEKVSLLIPLIIVIKWCTFPASFHIPVIWCKIEECIAFTGCWLLSDAGSNHPIRVGHRCCVRKQEVTFFFYIEYCSLNTPS